MAIPEIIKKMASDIRTKIYGREVRESLARGIEVAGDIADDTRVRQDSLESQFTAVLESTTDKDVISAPEIIAARVGADDTTYDDLKERLDSENAKVNLLLEQNSVNLNSREINILYPPPPLMPAHADNINDDSPIINNIINFLSDNGGGHVFVPNGIYYTETEIQMRENVFVIGGPNAVLDAKGNSSLTQITTPTPTITELVQTTDISKGDRTIQIDNSVQKGDFVEITSTDRFTAEWDEGIVIRNYYTNGEVLEVESATPTSITFTEPVSFNYPLASSRWVRAYTPTKNIGVKSIQLTRNYSTSGNGSGITFQYTKDFELENITVEHANASGILTLRSRHGNIKKIKGIGGETSLGLNYLVNLNSGSKFINVDVVHGSNFRHVTTAGGSYVVSMENTFKNIFAENSQNQSIDLHGNTMNFVYENVFCDKGINICGVGHVVKGVKSKEGAFYMTEGGKNISFENVFMENCNSFRSDKTCIGIKFKNVEIDIKSLVSLISFGTNPRDFTFENTKILNKRIRNVANNAEADAMFSGSVYRGLLIGENFKVDGLTIEGFPISLEILGEDSVLNDITLVNCGWVSSVTGQPSTVIKYSQFADHGRINGAKIICNLPQLNLAQSRIFTLSTSGDADTCNLTLENISDGYGHNNNYGTGVVGGTDYAIFMQNVRPTVTTGSSAFAATGKFIYNTVVADN